MGLKGFKFTTELKVSRIMNFNLPKKCVEPVCCKKQQKNFVNSYWFAE